MATAAAAAAALPPLPLPLPAVAAAAAARLLPSVSTKYLSGKSEETPAPSTLAAGSLCFSAAVGVGVIVAVGVAVVDTGSCCSGSSTKAEPSKRLAGVSFVPTVAPAPAAVAAVVAVVPLNLDTCCCCCCCS